MRCLNASLTTPDSSSLSSRRRHHERSRVSVVTRVAQDRSDAAAPTVPSSSDRTAAGFIAIATSSSHVVAGTTTAVTGSVVSGRSDVQHHNGHPLQGGPQGPPMSGYASSTAQQVPSASNSSYSSSSSSRPGDVGPSSRSNNGWPSRQGLGDFSSSSSSSSSGGGGGPASTAADWQPPSYRHAGLRLRSKRALQAAEKMQQAGKSLIAEELQKMLTSTSSSSDAADAEDRDQHLEAFIEQMFCPKTSIWKRAEAAPGAAADGREAIDPDVLANIHTLPVAQITQQQVLLARRGQLLAALLLLEEAAAAGRRDVMLNTEQKAFLRAAGKQGNTAAVLRFLQLLPAEMARAHTYNLALKACADARDLRAALRVVDIMGIRQVPTDFKHFTTLIAVCASTGDANQAFAVFQKAKAAEQQVAAAAAAAAAAAGADKQQQKAAGKVAPRMDGQVYGALIAACAQAIRVRSSDLREQLVILERAFQVLQEGVDAGVYLDTPVWNALLMCTGRCRQLQRCFEVLDRMTAAGVPSNSITYTCLIEAAVLSGDVDMAQRVFARAMATGVTNSVQLYTAAINACMTDDHTNFDAAFEIYTTMQRHGVEPDDLLYGHLIAIAGRCRKLEVAFDLLEDMRASGLTPSTPTCSALIYACLQNNNFAAARKVYDTLIARGVSPHISQYNSLMEQYALRFQLGNVVSVLTSMVAGGVQPNANTFRILLLACQRTDQAELAFELYQVMKARGLQPRLNNAHSICYTLLTACFSRIRKSWWPGGYPPKPTSDMGPYSNLPGLRSAEARQLLQVLQPGAFQAGKGGSSAAAAAGSSARQAQQQARRYNFLDNSENINWSLLALSTYRDFISWGYKPHLEVLDKLLACLRLQLPKSPQRPAAELQQRAVQLQAQLQPLQHPDTPGDLSQQHTSSSSGAAEQADLASSMQQQGQGQGQGPRQWLQTAGLLRDLARERRMQESEDRPYEVPFDKRAIDAVVDAIGMGLLPALKLDAPLVVDMRSFPPSVAEAYVHMLMSTLESRAASAAAEGKRQPVAQRVRLIVPPFDHNYVMWPSYVEKLHVHYSEQLLARQAQLRYEAMAARARAAALAAQNLDGDEDEDIADDQLLLTFGSTAAAAGAAVGSGSSPAASAALRAAMLAQGGQSAAIAMAAAAAGRGRRAAASMMRSWDVSEFGDDLLGADMTGYSAALASSQPGVATAAQGRYIAGAVTGLAAAATFRRLKAYARMDSAAGAIKLESQELNRWMMAKVRYEDERRRIAREAEIAAAGYSNNLQYYQQQQQQQQQQAQQPGQQWAPNTNSWQQQQQQPAQGQPPQQQQQQQLLPQVQQEQQRLVAVDQGGAANGSSKQGGPAAAGAAAGRTQGSSGQGPGSSQRPVRGYSSSWEQPQQQQQQQQFMPGFGPRPGAAGVSGLRQQARDIRLGIGPAAAAGLNRPNRGSAAAAQQQPALTHVQPTGPQQQVQQSAAQEGSPDSSSSSNTSGSSSSTSSKSSRSRRAHRQAAAAAAGSGAESAAEQSGSVSSSVDQQ